MARRLTTEKFVAKAEAVHGDRYDYSSVNYVNNHSNVAINCPDHGPFTQTPKKHLSRQGCPDCGGNKPLTTETFVEQAKAIHGDRYDYSDVEYVNASTHVTIICHDHGPFPQVPRSHILQESGCPDCGGTKQLTTETFIDKAIAVRGDCYDYSDVEYVNNKTEVTINCRDHGPFQQTPTAHVSNVQGCPDCAVTGFNPNESGTLYYLAVTTDNGNTRYKIGITNRAVEERFASSDLARIRIVKTWRYAVGHAAAEHEAEILSQYARDKYYGPDILQSGNTELFTHDILGLDK